ncbi:H/ACA ribonucleoprotein complex non-core subunit NAF1-like [Argonauta hians]
MDLNEPAELTEHVEINGKESVEDDTITTSGKETPVSTLDVSNDVTENSDLTANSNSNNYDDTSTKKEEECLNTDVIESVAISEQQHTNQMDTDFIEKPFVNEEVNPTRVANGGVINISADNITADTDDKLIDSTTENQAPIETKNNETPSMDSAIKDFDLDAKHTRYRSGNAGDAVDLDSDSSTSDNSPSSEDEAQTNSVVKQKNLEEEKAFEKPKVKGELGLEDLPPIEDLKITADEKVELICVGSISTVIESLVIIESLESESSPLNDDSILFLEDRTSLGQVFEIFGPVRCPLYSVRFNSSEDIKEKGLQIGTKIYYAPKEEKYTNYVFVKDLMKQKGSDASWEHDLEPPDKFLDYSDDEQERLMKKNKKKCRADHSGSDIGSGDEGSSQIYRKRDSREKPFHMKNRSQRSENYKKNYDNGNYLGNMKPYHSSQDNSWHSNTYTQWPPNRARNQNFDSYNRNSDSFSNRPPYKNWLKDQTGPNNWGSNSDSWHSSTSHAWSTNITSSWSQNTPNNWSQNNPNTLHNWSQSSPKTLNKWSQKTPNTSNNWSQNNPNTQNSWSQSSPNTPNNWSQNTPNTPNNWSQNTPNTQNNWSQNNPNTQNNWSQNTQNSWPQNPVNSLTPNNCYNWSQTGSTSLNPNNPNISSPNTIPNGSPQMNNNIWPSTFSNNQPPLAPNVPPPNLFSIPPPNFMSGASFPSTSVPPPNTPHHPLPPPNFPSFNQAPQLPQSNCYPPPSPFPPPSFTQWSAQHVNNNNADLK